jgi:hypothetical protein
MQMQRSALFLTNPLIGLLAAAVMIPSTANAEDEPAAGTSLSEDGSFIYSRDVHHNIGDRYLPRESQSAVTAPTRQIVDTIALGLEPLTDNESSSVLAPLTGLRASDPSLVAAMQVLGTGSASTSLAAASNSASSTVNSAISGAMQSLSGAMDSLSALPGGGR